MSFTPNFEKLNGNMLSSIQVGRPVWKRFGSDTLNRFMNANPDEIWDNDIATLTECLTPFLNHLSSDLIDLGIGKGITYTKGVIVKNFVKLAMVRNIKVIDVFGKESAEYPEFFPKGMSAIHRASLVDVGLYMNAIITAGEKYATQLPADFTQPIKDIRTSFVAITNSHTKQKQAIDTDKGALNDDVEKLQMILSKLINGVNYRYHNDIAKFDVYFDFSIIKIHQQHEPIPGKMFPGKILAGVTKIVYKEVTAKSVIKILNDGLCTINCSLDTIEAGPATGGIEILSGETGIFDCESIPDVKLPFLKITNPNVDVEGSYLVEIK